MSITQVIRWQTSDGTEHSSREWAERWEAKLESAEKATAMLDAGATVAECLRAIKHSAEIDAVLETVTKETELVISHWQCRDTPGYKPTRFCADGRVVAYGNAGAWNGAYGGKISIQELAQYARHTFAK